MSKLLLFTELPSLRRLSSGKVRDVYETSDSSSLLFVATDRISAYDVVLNNGIPGKGKILTELSLFWFHKLGHIISNHFITAAMNEMPSEVRQYHEQLEGRSMLVRKAQVIPIEAIVRGYITGSAWSEYKKHGTVHSIKLPEGLLESQKLEAPLFTPSTKAEQGKHDENIHPDRAAELIGRDVYDLVADVSIRLYKAAAEYALSRGVILADTKFEFGLLPMTAYRGKLDARLILIDEVLTPDSSRYWPADSYSVGVSQASFDKQYLRDWLVGAGFKKGLESGPPGQEGKGWTISEAVVEETAKRYQQARELLIRAT